MATNRYPARCALCGFRVPANGGNRHRTPRGWAVLHIACEETGNPLAGVIGITFNSGATVTRNRRGVCEDAPCCGCCTF